MVRRIDGSTKEDPVGAAREQKIGVDMGGDIWQYSRGSYPGFGMISFSIASLSELNQTSGLTRTKKAIQN